MDHEDNVLAYLNDTNIEDRFTLKQLLEAADVDLDSQCKIRHFNNSNRPANFLGYEEQTLRSTGLVLHITLHYTNIPESLTPTSKLPDIRYFYRVHQIMETPFQQQHYLNDHAKDTNYDKRTLVTRNGIHIKFVQSGVIGRFSLKTLIVNLLAVTGLMSVVAMLCDFFSETILPYKDKFENIKYTYAEMETGPKPTPASSGSSKKTNNNNLKKRTPKKHD